VEQLADLEAKGHQIVGLSEGMALGSRSINTPAELGDMIERIEGLAAQHAASAVYGVFSAPVQSVIADRTSGDTGVGLACYASWNVSRSEEGGKPTFAHRAFLWVGIL
jgi:hypothetical protein